MIANYKKKLLIMVHPTIKNVFINKIDNKWFFIKY